MLAVRFLPTMQCPVAGEEWTSVVSDQNQQKEPPYSFSTMTAVAILSSPDRRLPMAEIHWFVMNRFPYLCTDSKRCYKSIAVTLSTNKRFVKVESPPWHVAGAFWSLRQDALEISDNGSVSLRAWVTKSMRPADQNLLDRTMDVINRRFSTPSAPPFALLTANTSAIVPAWQIKSSVANVGDPRPESSVPNLEIDAFDKLSWISLAFGQDPNHVAVKELEDLLSAVHIVLS